MTPLLGPAAIQSILPHRPPFLFVDEVTELVPGERIVGRVHADRARCLGRDAKGEPSFPPTLLTEALAQLGAILVLHPPELRGRTIYFRSIEHARFRRTVPLGATVRLEGVMRRRRGRLGSLAVGAYVGDELAVDGVMGFALSG